MEKEIFKNMHYSVISFKIIKLCVAVLADSKNEIMT